MKNLAQAELTHSQVLWFSAPNAGIFATLTNINPQKQMVVESRHQMREMVQLRNVRNYSSGSSSISEMADRK